MNTHDFLERALTLAEQGRYTTYPNPRVGCVIAKDGTILGEGYHQYAGQEHAEINALQNVKDKGLSSEGATAYVTLEPCNHHGKTPPCAWALINAGIKEVVIASRDPNPEASNGWQTLVNAGIAVSQYQPLTQAADMLNRGFFKAKRLGMPFVTLKSAISLDGRIALKSGESKWITGTEAREDAQRIRAASSAILTGTGTVLTDNPRYTVRPSAEFGDNPRQPLRVIIDAKARLRPELQIFQQGGPILLITLAASQQALSEIFASANIPTEVEIKTVDADSSGRVDLAKLLHVLATEYHCYDLMVEAGGQLSGAFVQANLVDEFVIYQAPTFLGHEAKACYYLNIPTMAAQKRLTVSALQTLGNDIKYIATPQKTHDPDL
jgi:diaminohydroxyphosphoribosylaminopyrimidine deaminase/5-amino-6-(5-phosphoribosylamino)uracil reductase